MKSIFRILTLVVALFMVSCTKEEVTPTTPGGASTVHVEYRVYDASAHAIVTGLLPAPGQTNLTEQTFDLARMNYSQSFEVVSGTQLSISAKNATPGPEEVTTEIYVNGTLLASASATAPGQTATSTGIAK